MNVLKPGIFSDSPRSKVWKAAQQSQFFAWSLHSPAPELEQGSAAFASPGTPVCSEKEWICDEEWEKDDLPPTPLSPLSRDLRGKRQLAEELESETPTEDEAVSAPAQPAPRMISDRLAKVKPQPVRVFKARELPEAWLRIEASRLVWFR